MNCDWSRSAFGAMARAGRCLHRRTSIVLLAGAVTSVVPGLPAAEEGVWTFDHPPSATLQAKYGFEPKPEWLDALRLSAVRVGGASGSFVSAKGLVLTNHHVALSCIQGVSSEASDFVAAGFLAGSRSEEKKCPGMELLRLESTEDVTAMVRAAMKAEDAATVNAQRNAAIARIENACREKTRLRCEIVTLYRGGAYWLYRYRVWTDVRLVFAPESNIGFFGGDADNFVYPRFDLDTALLRVYESGEPLHSEHYLKWASTGVTDGDLVFAAGHPYSTNRLFTVTQVVFDRDVRYPLMIASAKRHRKVLQEFGARSPEAARRAAHILFGTENWLKAMLGESRALQEPALLAAKRNDESRLRTSFEKTAGNSDPWTAIDVATQKDGATHTARWVIGYGYDTLFDKAGKIVELAGESTLSDTERLAAYRASAIPRLTLRITASEPIYKDLEIARLAGYWQEALDLLGPDDPFVKRVLHGKSPLDAATEVITGTRLDQADERKRLVDGGPAAVAASKDPLIALARDVYPMRRRLAKIYEVEIETPTLRAGDDLERLRFRLFGVQAYPDATGSLRLSYGTVRGYDADGIRMPWQTNFWGLYGRSSAFGGQAPFDLPRRWLDSQRNIRLNVPLNFVSTLDIIGGNSGSPIVNRKGELVGLVFDGNLEGLGGRYVYTDEKARAIAVDARAIIEALDSVYRAKDLVAEITRP
jgi:hypothetical protein